MYQSMSQASKIFSNTIWQIGLRIVELVIGVITLGLITRYLGQTNYGYYTTIMAWLQLVSITLDFGLYLTLLRELSARPEAEHGKILNNIFTLRLVTATIGFVIGCLLIQFFPYPAEIKVGVLALVASFFFVSLVTVLTALFQKSFTMPRVAISSLASKIVLLALIVYAIGHQTSLQGILYASSAASAVFFLLILYWTYRAYRLGLACDLSYWKSVLIKTWPLAVTTTLNLIYFKIDTVFLSFYQPASEVGIYGAAYRVLEIVTTFPHMFMGLLLPLFTAAWVAQDYPRLHQIWQKAFDVFALITIPMVAGTLIVATPLMTLVAGPDFASAGPVLAVLIVATGIIFFGTLGTYLVLTMERQKQMMKYFLLAALLSVLGYWLTIPRFSYWGAAWVTVGIELLIVLFAWIVVRKQFAYRPKLLVAGKSLLASIIMMIVIAGLYFLPLLIQIIVGAIIYILGLLLTSAISWTEIKSLLKPHD